MIAKPIKMPPSEWVDVVCCMYLCECVWGYHVGMSRGLHMVSSRRLGVGVGVK